MESEEAIMENENNSNLESESNIRDQQHKTSDGFGDTNAASYLTEPRDVSSAEALWENSDLSLPEQNLNTASLEAYSSSSATPKEPVFDTHGATNFETEEESTEIPVSSASVSIARDHCVTGYEEYFGGDEISPNKVNVQSRVFENITSELSSHDGIREYTHFSNSRSEEDMEVDSSRLDPTEDSTASFLEQANVDQPIVSDDIVEPDFFTSLPLVVQEGKLINDQGTSEESAALIEPDLSGSTSSRNINAIPNSAKNWDVGVGLLDEDSMDFINKDSAQKEEDISIPVLSTQESTFKGACLQFEDDDVTERLLEPLPEAEITKHDSPETVIEKSPASLVSTHPNDSQLLNDDGNNPEELSQSTPSQPVPTLMDVHDDNDLEETLQSTPSQPVPTSKDVCNDDDDLVETSQSPSQPVPTSNNIYDDIDLEETSQRTPLQIVPTSNDVCDNNDDLEETSQSTPSQPVPTSNYVCDDKDLEETSQSTSSQPVPTSNDVCDDKDLEETSQSTPSQPFPTSKDACSDNDIKETSPGTPSQPVPSSNVVCGGNLEEEDNSEDAMLHLQSEAFVEQCTNITFNKTLSDTNVADSLVAESLRDTDIDVAESLRDTDIDVAESLRDTDNDVAESLRDTDNDVAESLRDTDNDVAESLKDTDNDVAESLRDTDSFAAVSLRDTDSDVAESLRDTRRYGTESFGFADTNVTADIINDNPSDESSSLQDGKLEMDCGDDALQLSEIESTPEPSEISIFMKTNEQSPQETGSAISDPCVVNVALGDAPEMGVGINSSADSLMSSVASEHFDSLVEDTDRCTFSKEDSNKGSTEVASRVSNELDQATSYEHSRVAFVSIETALDESKEDLKESSMEVVDDVTTELGLTASMHSVVEGEGSLSEEAGKDTTVMGHSDAVISDHTTTIHGNLKQFDAASENKDISFDVLEDTTMVVDDVVNAPDNTGSADNAGLLHNAGSADNTGSLDNIGSTDNTGSADNTGSSDNTGSLDNTASTEQPDQFDTGAQPKHISDESTTLLMDYSSSVSEHADPSENQKQLDNSEQNISSEDLNEESTKIEGPSDNVPDHNNSFEHPKYLDDFTDEKNDISEDSVLEDAKEMPVDADFPSNHRESGQGTSSEHQQDVPVHISVPDTDTTGEETMDELLQPPQQQTQVETLESSCSIDLHSDDKNSSDVHHSEDELTETVSAPMEIVDDASTTTQINQTVDTKEPPHQSPPPNTAGLHKNKIKLESTKKVSTVHKGGVRYDDSEDASTSHVSPPSKSMSKVETPDDVKEISLLPKKLVTNIRKVTEDNVVQLKADPAPSKRTRRPERSKRTSIVKEKVVDEGSEDDIKIVSVKTDTLNTKTTENGLDGVSVSEQQYQLQNNAEKSPAAASSKDNKKTESSKSKSSKSKVQTCLVCQKICKCKYNIVRNGDVKHLCDDACFKQFRKTPSVFLKSNDNVKPSKKSAKTSQSATAAKDTLALYHQQMESRQKNNYKTCAVCQLLNLNTSEPFCNWKGLDFCGESCLGKFQANLNTSCSFCHAYIPIDMRATCCIKIANDMRPFCKQRCYNEFKKKLRLCSFCQRDVAGVSGAFTAMVGTEGKFKEFCSQTCMKQLENDVTDFHIIGVEKGILKPETMTCFICRKRGPLKYTAQFEGKLNKLCSDTCLSAFKYVKKINMETCDNCSNTCTAEEVQAHFVHYDGQIKHFCSDSCASLFRKANSKVVQCAWCGSKKLNFDMIEKTDGEDVLQVFCSLNCLSLDRVNLQAKSDQVVSCDQCRKVEPAQYHLTMSDASVRNFCSYSCVMTFQSHFASKYTSPGSGPPSVVPSPQVQPQPPQPLLQQQSPQTPTTRVGRGRINTRQASARHMSPTVPVISSVVSLAVPHAGDQKSEVPLNTQTPPPQVPPEQLATGTTLPAASTAGSVLQSADGKHQILIQAAPPKSGKNRSSQCRPVTQTKSTSCRPHTQSRETQTDEIAPKCVMVPIPVPIYIPVPTVMFSAPAPKFVPFPIPIPVPIFIPTTRKSATGISKAIQEIVERMPSDPLEAELLMMAEAVAADRRPGDSDTDSEADTGGEDYGVSVEEEVARPPPREDEALMLRKREGQGEEDMIQMALRMAEEMSGPIEDLETSVEPVAVSSETSTDQQPHQSIQPYENQVDGDYIPARSNQRGAKRPSRGRPPTSRVKRQRVDKPYNEDDSMPSEHSTQLQSMEPPPDVNYRLKFTYGVNAWRHWIVSKNAQIEKTRQMTGSYRLRPFSTDILKCTTEELNYTLCMFIKEVRKPNGDEYSPDSIYYLCLGIQQYLYENSRIDNIFTDAYFEKFTDSLNDILKSLQPKVNTQGQMLCRIEEEHMWESKQLGAHSPFILLNTLIYFHTKHFILKTAQEHMSLSFAQILKHWKKGMPLKGQSAASGKNVSLRFYCLANGKKDGLAARKNKDGVPVYEVTENFDNPLRCPVKLYEFFLSKCPESIKNRNDIFYPVPERSCVPDSPVWYSTQSIDVHTMDKMLTRVLLVREIQEAHLHAQPIYM